MLVEDTPDHKLFKPFVLHEEFLCFGRRKFASWLSVCIVFLNLSIIYHQVPPRWSDPSYSCSIVYTAERQPHKSMFSLEGLFETIPPKKSFLENTCLRTSQINLRMFYKILMFAFVAKLNSIKLRTTHRMNSTTFANLVKLGGGMKKKAKKKKGKPGKVWNC